ncbi:MAG: hypothetical protein C0501_19485 [Isosphaera sp.]|nr:hypothetical protein [Isosphaera sp.]
MSPSLLLAAALAAALAAPPEAAPEPPGESRYFFTLFGGQSVPFRPRTAHTWGAYAKVTPTPGGLAVETVTISWLPASGPVQPLRRSVEGRNYTLEETLAIVAGNDAQVSRWGPYEIDAGRYELARRQAAFLESGAVRFRSVDSFSLNRTVVNCVHALTHADPGVEGYPQPVIRVGEPGTARLATLYARGGTFPAGPEPPQDWVVPLIGADRYPTTARYPGERVRRQFR